MGRGLSELQQWIVEETRKRGRLYYADICEGFYGWERKADAGQSPGSQKFSPKDIGEKEYSRVMATISRSCRRLERRGLVRCIQGRYSRWSGVEPVEQGGEDE